MKDTHIDNKVLIREFHEETDVELVERLERNCEIESKKGISIFTNMMGDPLCRIRFYSYHVLLVAEMVENGELVGVVRGCIKRVGTGIEGAHLRMGCILGLRVSPKHRRKGIGLALVKSIEDWAIRNGAEYLFAAAEANNIASTTLFSIKCNYVKIQSLVIFMQPIHFRCKDLSPKIRIAKLSIEQAISLYKTRLEHSEFFPVDIDVILNEELSLGTWVSFFKEEGWTGLDEKEKNEDVISRIPSSWAILSIWKTCEAYKLHIRRQQPFKCFHATLFSHAGSKVFPCLRTPICDLPHKPFGFLFLYGIHGEGEHFGELIKSLWYFAYNLARNVKDCNVIITELGYSDPVKEHVPRGSSMSCVNDVWFLKKIRSGGDVEEEIDIWTKAEKVSSLFVDPRDF